MKALVMENVSKNFGGIQALLDINLSIAVGERWGLIGPNGAGKTTLFHLISGVLPLSQGSISLFGVDITRMPSYKRPSLGLGRTYQITQLFSKLTVLGNVLMGLMAPDPARFSLLRPITSYPHLIARRQELLEMWGLWEKRDVPVCDLSYGEQRQLEIILALAPKPKLLLLDEPTAGLAAAETEAVCSMIQALPGNITMFIIEHDMDTASKLVDQVTVLNMGKMLAEGSWEQIRTNRQVQDIYLGAQEH
jgi:branched-chain amino acid transport system ATP-binding protein